MDAANIYIEPPDPNEITDEDSGEEDGGLVDNLCGRQLQASAEIEFTNGQRVGDFSISYQESIPNPPSTYQVFSFPTVEQPKWTRGNLESNGTFSKPNYSFYTGMSPTHLFELFFDDEVIKLLITESLNYAVYKGFTNTNLSTDEIKCFVGILILSGYNTLPGRRFYWDTSPDMQNIIVRDCMRRDRFEEICRILHCADNSNINADKYYKLRPLKNLLQNRFLKHFIPEQELNYDESMIKYFGRHSCKQFIRGKPIRFGFKAWCINTASGYLVNFDFYQGNNPNTTPEIQLYFGKCTAPFYEMLKEFPTDKINLPYKFFFDNLFTNQTLLRFLSQNGYNGTGTIRINRLPKNIKLTEKAAWKKKDRGTFEYILDKNNGIHYSRWLDNSVITVASTCFGSIPTSGVKRFSRKEKKTIIVQRPLCIGQYNQFMGGTDLMDENVNRYRIGLRGKKWWWCLFTWLIDVSIQNAWILHKKSGGNLSQLEFRRDIVKTYLITYRNLPKRPGPSAKIPDAARYDGRDHLIIPVANGMRRRCAADNCTSKGRTQCLKCNVGLCVVCFASYHGKKYN